MKIKARISYMYKELRDSQKSLHVMKDDNYSSNFTAAELIRNTHSIEKGLSIEKPRLGFGHAKQKEMLLQIDELQSRGSNYYVEICDMALCALREYIDYHEARGYSDDFCIELKDYLTNHPTSGNAKIGGTINVCKNDLRFDTQALEHFFNTRHSIRDFEQTPVDNELLKKALILAQKAPSACNRQGVRAYVLSADKSKDFAKSLPGIGGFAEEVGRFILITGKKSAYRITENYQYIVSASIYAAYLSLTLHLYGLGACVVQRPVVWTKEWESKRKAFGIESDEQLVLLLAVGNLKDSFNVPLSHRLSEENIVQFVD